uniref:Uncharacterized protein n=1 Tax=Dunaliella viridis TaxID=140095 RepID=Q0ZBM4_9CHLO|nr:hypothetical protein [Dunaliella viridis]
MSAHVYAHVRVCFPGETYASHNASAQSDAQDESQELRDELDGVKETKVFMASDSLTVLTASYKERMLRSARLSRVTLLWRSAPGVSSLICVYWLLLSIGGKAKKLCSKYGLNSVCYTFGHFRSKTTSEQAHGSPSCEGKYYPLLLPYTRGRRDKQPQPNREHNNPTQPLLNTLHHSLSTRAPPENMSTLLKCSATDATTPDLTVCFCFALQSSLPFGQTEIQINAKFSRSMRLLWDFGICHPPKAPEKTCNGIMRAQIWSVHCAYPAVARITLSLRMRHSLHAARCPKMTWRINNINININNSTGFVGTD